MGELARRPMGIDTSDATATAAKIISGFTAYANGNKLIGTAFEGVSLSTVSRNSGNTAMVGTWDFTSTTTNESKSGMVVISINNTSTCVFIGIYKNGTLITSWSTGSVSASIDNGYVTVTNPTYGVGTMYVRWIDEN